MVQPKVIFIEWDGASWQIIEKFLALGKLPNLKRLINSGTACVLPSEAPYISPRLWTTIYTGKAAAKHGIEFFGADSRSVKCKRVWDIAEDYGRAIGVFGTLVTWPPRPANGFIVPSVFALGPECYPPELRFIQELTLSERRQNMQQVGRLRQGLRYFFKLWAHGVKWPTFGRILRYTAVEKLRRPSFLDRYWQAASIYLRLTTEVFCHLYAKVKPDMASFHIHLCDSICHQYWAFWEPQRFPGIPEELLSRLQQVIPRAYQEVDVTVGEIAALAGPETTLIIGSDHGFGPQSVALFPYMLRTDRFLQVMELEKKVLPANIARITYLYFQDSELKAEVKKQLEQVNFPNSDVPLFRIRDEENYLEVLVRAEHLLNEIQDDVPIDLGPRGIHPFGTLFSKAGLHLSGVHEPEGILVLSGRAVKSGANIKSPAHYDLAPTMLALLGLPVGEDMDGRVLTEALTDEWLRDHPVSYVPTHEVDSQEAPSEDNDNRDYDKIKERLRSLGYL